MIKRTLSNRLVSIASFFPVVLLTGPRQVGKTTIAKHFAGKNYDYVSLDDLESRKAALNDPAMFLQNHKPPIVIDEIQYAPDLFIYIKIYVDNHPEQNGLFILTGSQKFNLMKGIRESLAGRVAIIDVLGLSHKEIIDQADSEPFFYDLEWIDKVKNQPVQDITTKDIYERIWKGSFPKLINQNSAERKIFYQSYIKTYIERDVKDSYNITNTISFYNFIQVVAARTGQLLNFADIARDVGIDAKTAKQWLSLLELSGLVKLLYPYHNNITKRIIKTPKLYFLDTGLCAYLTRWNTPEQLETGAMSGAILETYVYSEILKSYWHKGEEIDLYFYRDKDQKEVDFVFERNGFLYPIEVKKTLMPTESAIKSFKTLENLSKPIGEGIVLCLKPKVFHINRKVVSVPIWYI